jgi:hypothetical protein
METDKFSLKFQVGRMDDVYQMRNLDPILPSYNTMFRIWKTGVQTIRNITICFMLTFSSLSEGGSLPKFSLRL